MIYRNLFEKVAPDKVIRAGIIGTGHFATATLTQSQVIPRLDVPAVADLDVEAARRAFRHAGYTDVAVCEDRSTTLRALEKGRRVIVPEAQLLMDLPLDVIVEATGVPEAGAHHATLALAHGKHVAMVNKETDATVGPILHQMAEQAGLVYTPVDGDQHGLLIGLVAWCRELGLEVLCGGKARDAEFVYDPATRTVYCGRQALPLAPADADWLQPISAQPAGAYVEARRQMLAPLPQVASYDLVEMAIVANATGLQPDRPTLHGAILYTSEIPEALCPTAEGGILQRRGVVDVVTSLHYPHEAGLGGGVFVVVACTNDYSRHILISKGLLSNRRTSAALIYRPYHLCGVETPVSILCAGLLGVSTGGRHSEPHVDVVARTTTDLPAGTVLGNDHDPRLQALLIPAQPIAPGSPLPLHLGNGRPLAVDVPADTLITADMVVVPQDSTLWSLRARQDQVFARMADEESAEV